MADVNFVDYDAESILAEAVGIASNLLGEQLAPSDERRIMLDCLVSIITNVYATINEAGRQTLLQSARGAYLDAIGDTRGVARLPAMAAQCTLRFTLSAARTAPVTVPAGTRVTLDSKIFWAIKLALSIPAGSTYGDAPAQCLAAGAEYNGYAAGSLTAIVDPVLYIASVTNIDTTSGGADAETDEAYRERIHGAVAIYSTAGSIAAYKYHALTASAAIIDVLVDSPSAGNVRIVPLVTTGIPSEAVLEAVEAACSADTVRPLTDHVTAAAPTAVSYDITLTYYVPASKATELQAVIEGEGGAIDQYITYQMGALGRGIEPDKLTWYLLNAGANYATITAPTRTALGEDEVAIIGTKTIIMSTIAGV